MLSNNISYARSSTVYSNCEEVRLTVFENGKKYVYQRSTDKCKMPSPIITFEDAFHFMELKALARSGKRKEAYILAEGLINGKIVATNKKYPSWRPVSLRLRVDDDGLPLRADGSDVVTVIAEIVDEMSRLSYEKAREDLILQISKMYYLGQVTAEQIALIKANITRLEELRDITQAFFDNGMAMEVDLKRVNINLENLKVQYDNAQAMMTQQLNMLKYIMDYPAEKEIGLLPVNTDSIATVALTGLSENLYELQLLQSQVQLAERQKRLISIFLLSI